MVRVLVYLYYRRKLVLVLAYNILLIYHVPSTKCVVINLALLARPLFGTLYRGAENQSVTLLGVAVVAHNVFLGRAMQ